MPTKHIPIRLIHYLREHGHEVIEASEFSLAGQPDDVLFRLAKRRRASLITSDLDFSNLQTYSPKGHLGIVVIRTHS